MEELDTNDGVLEKDEFLELSTRRYLPHAAPPNPAGLICFSYSLLSPRLFLPWWQIIRTLPPFSLSTPLGAPEPVHCSEVATSRAAA